jgi:hypothetical protein
MEPKPKTALAGQKRAYRLWFEYLRVARRSTDQKVRAALKVFQPFYAPWEMDKGESYDAWWKTHGHLFEEKFVVRELKAAEPPLDPDALILEVPLTESPTILARKAKSLIQAAFEARERTAKKAKKKPTAIYQLTTGSEPKLDAVREMLSIYRDVYLRNPKLRGEKLLDAASLLFRTQK